jgi:hypothetical protein
VETIVAAVIGSTAHAGVIRQKWAFGMLISALWRRPRSAAAGGKTPGLLLENIVTTTSFFPNAQILTHD